MFNFSFFNSKPLPQLDAEVSTLAENLEDPIFVFDNNFRISYLNPAAEKTFKISKTEILGKTLTPQEIKNPRLSDLAQVFFPSLASQVRELSAAGTWPQRAEIRTSGGEVFKSVLVRLTPSSGQTFFIRTLRNQHQEISAKKSKEEFVGIAAHRIRTPLTALHWALEQLSSTVPENLKDLANQALELSERSLKIANDLLDAARLEDGRMELSLELVDLNEIISAAVKELTSLAENKKVKINWLPQNPLKLKIDPNKIGFVVANLIDNAVKYNVENGQVTISLEISPNLAKVVIKDTGIGISETNLQRLFEKLWRGENAISAEPNGSGLGLYIAKNIVELHGGQIGAQSTLNRGSIFWFSLPLQAPSAS